MPGVTDSLRLDRRIVLVTGAAGDIGRAICTAFRDVGAHCVGADLHGSDTIVPCDVSDEGSVHKAFDMATQQGTVTDVVHAAGVVSVGAVSTLSVDELERVLRVNLVGSFLVAREAARRLPDQGTISFISSQAGLKSGALWSAYSASKAGVNRLAESLAQELGPRGIRVNAVCPGYVATAMASRAISQVAQLKGTTAATLLDRYKNGIPLGRLATPDEIGRVCVFLASPLASYVSGTALLVDGGELSG